MACSMAIIIIGFLLMSGGGAESPDTFNPEIFSVRRTMVAPIVCLVGFLLMVYALLAKPSTGTTSASSEEGSASSGNK